MKKFFAVSILIVAVVSVLVSLQLSATPKEVVTHDRNRPIISEHKFEFIEFEPMEFKVESSVIR